MAGDKRKALNACKYVKTQCFPKLDQIAPNSYEFPNFYSNYAVPGYLPEIKTKENFSGVEKFCGYLYAEVLKNISEDACDRYIKQCVETNSKFSDILNSHCIKAILFCKEDYLNCNDILRHCPTRVHAEYSLGSKLKSEQEINSRFVKGKAP